MSKSNQDCGLVISGRFANALLTNFLVELGNFYKQIIIVNGSLRNGELPEIFTNTIQSTKFIFLDDSFYSGKTRNIIEKTLQDIDPRCKIVKTIVVYDGSITPEYNVYSMFRYHKK